MSSLFKTYGFSIGDFIQEEGSLLIYQILGKTDFYTVKLKIISTSKCKSRKYDHKIGTIDFYHVHFLKFFKKCEKPRPTWEV